MSNNSHLARSRRVARGLSMSTAATVLAAASHGLAGGAISWFGILATAIVAMPLATLLAGRLGSLWRTSSVVVCSQFLFHWSFSGLTTPFSSFIEHSSASLPASQLHTAHLAAINTFTASLGTPATGLYSELTMWGSHLLAAALTTWLIHSGERAWISLRSAIHRSLLFRKTVFRCTPLHRTTRYAQHNAAQQLTEQLCQLLSISRRGPPAVSSFVSPQCSLRSLS